MKGFHKVILFFHKVWNHPDIYQRACANGASHLAEFDGEVLVRGNSNNDYLVWVRHMFGCF